MLQFAMAVNDDVEQCMFPVFDGDDHDTAMNKVSILENSVLKITAESTIKMTGHLDFSSVKICS